MNFVAQMEDYLRDLGSEARKKHRGVKEASERAILKLRTLQNEYVSAVRKAAADGEEHPTTALFRSSDLLHPFLLATNYPNASSKLLDTSFKAMKTLMEANAICPGDGENLVRVWMIQTNVVVKYSKKEAPSQMGGNKRRANKINSNDNSQNLSQASSEITDATAETIATGESSSTDVPASSTNSSSWFGSFLGSSSTDGSQSSTATKMSSQTPGSIGSATTMTVATKSAVSSSHGQAGSGHLNAKDLEKIALDILSCLLQLLELRDLPVTVEQWIQSVTICSLLQLPSRQTIRQAANSTLPQILTLLVQRADPDNEASDATSSKPSLQSLDLAVATWNDLLTCTVGLFTTKQTDGVRGQKKTQTTLRGAFSYCRVGEQDAAQPPSPSLSLDLMTTLLKEAPFVFAKVGPKTLGVIVQVLQKHSSNPNVSPMEYSRILQFGLVVIQTQFESWPEECRELVIRLIHPILTATEALRKQHDFEDGFSYEVSNNSISALNSLETLQGLTPTVLWKAGLALETLQSLVQDKSLKPLWMHPDIVVRLLEATSDFCTIGASCEDHMNLLVLASRKEKVELSYSAESLGSIQLWRNGKYKDETYMLGDALWAGMNAILSIIESLDVAVLDSAFAPALAVLQHYLKRFPASGAVVKRALEGYFSLAKPSLKIPLLRQALLTSLCKLSVPRWGTHDPTCHMKDHNVAALICLLNILHRYYEAITTEWSIVLQTFQELSVLAIASPQLSDDAYVGALTLSAIFSRFAAFTTCLSGDSLRYFVEGLREVALLDQQHHRAGGNNPSRRQDVLRVPNSKATEPAKVPDDKSSISEKIMGYGVRAIYGNEKEGENEDVPLAQRTKNTYSHDYEVEFAKRLVSAKHPVRISQAPFSCLLFLDAAMTNTFRSGSTILQQLCTIAAKSPSSLFFAMDSIAMITLVRIEERAFPTAFTGPGKILYQDPRQNQYLAVEAREDTLSRSEPVMSQEDLLRPLCNCLREVEIASVAECGIEALHTILESCGQRLTTEAWTVVIEAIASLPSPKRTSREWEKSCSVGFRCLKLIVDDFVGNTDAFTSARRALLDCCWSFGHSHHDVNTSLTAVGLLWTIADQDAGSAAIDLALSKLVILCSDSRAEVRNCAVNTLFSCIAGRGKTFTEKQWESCICGKVFGIYDGVTSKIGNGEDSSKETAAKPNSRYRVNVHQSRDSSDKQWVATQALVLHGLCRVLRAFFVHLLDSTDTRENGATNLKDETPWFEKAWNQILGFAFDAATQVGGRDTLDLRTTGAELLVLCAQLSCKAGAQAAIVPARVGTNMEVVNGALRSVRTPEQGSTNYASRRQNSSVTEMWRTNLFLDAFEVIDSFREHLESDASNHHESKLHPSMEPTQVQVLSKFAGDLSKLYDCCTENEFSEDYSFRHAENLDRLLQTEMPDPKEDDALVDKFTRIVVTVAVEASSGPESRFLSQAQRSCVDLLRSMASHGSPMAFVNLTILSAEAFFADAKEHKDANVYVDILSQQAATVLSEEFGKDGISNECRLLILYRILKRFIMDNGSSSSPSSNSQSGPSWSFEHLIPLFEKGLESAAMLGKTFDDPTLTNQNDALRVLLRRTWEYVSTIMAQTLSPVPDLESRLLVIPRPEQVASLVKHIGRNGHGSMIIGDTGVHDLCSVLCSGATKCLEVAELFVTTDIDNDADAGGGEDEQVRLQKRRREDTMTLFDACFGGVSTLDPNDARLHTVARDIFSSALDIISTNNNNNNNNITAQEDDIHVQACLLVCAHLQRDPTELQSIAIAVFSPLCQLVGAVERPASSTSTSMLRRAASDVLAVIPVGDILLQAQSQAALSEDRAARAERKMVEMSLEIEALQRQLALL